MSILRALRLSRAPAAALVAVGMLWGGFAALVPDIKLAVGASDAALGAALLMSAVGGMVSQGRARSEERASVRKVGGAETRGVWESMHPLYMYSVSCRPSSLLTFTLPRVTPRLTLPSRD